MWTIKNYEYKSMFGFTTCQQSWLQDIFCAINAVRILQAPGTDNCLKKHLYVQHDIYHAYVKIILDMW